jgi:hypothetical protein
MRLDFGDGFIELTVEDVDGGQILHAKGRQDRVSIQGKQLLSRCADRTASSGRPRVA